MKNPFRILLLLIIGLNGCNDNKKLTYLDSDEFDTKKERVRTLSSEIKSSSSFEDAEFELFNVNGFSNGKTRIAGASSWDYKFALKIEPTKIENWTNGMIKLDTTNQNLEWTKNIVEKRKNEWITKSKPEFYTRQGDNVIVIAYRTEGIIFKRVLAN